MLETILRRIDEKIEIAGKTMIETPHDELDRIANETAEAFIMAYEECKEIVSSVTEPKWIPVSERMPVGKEFEIEAGERTLYRKVIVQTTCIDMRTAYYNVDEQTWYDDIGNGLDVVVWRPLPEPYQAD